MEEHASTIPAEIHPVYMEPVYGCGERWTIAIAITTPDASKVINTVPASLSRCLGGLGTEIHNLASEVAGDLKAWLSRGNPLKNWEPLFSTCEIGAPLTADADDMEQAVAIAVSSFASLMAKEVNGDAEGMEPDHFGNRKWAAGIRDAAINQNPQYRGFFGRKAQVRHKEVSVDYSLGFLGGRLAANFACILPQSVTYGRGSAESDLFRLEQVRSHQQQSDLLSLQHFEMMAYTPRKAEMSTAEQRRVRTALDGLEAFADAHQLRLNVFHDYSQAAERILKMEGG